MKSELVSVSAKKGFGILASFYCGFT